MYILINGAFGVGKTTVARELRRRLSAVIFDPEKIGFILQRIPSYSKSDFQDLPAWRRLTILGARSVGAFRRTVLIPMAFSEVRYLDEVRAGLASPTRPVLHFCLTAPLSVVQSRLAHRGEHQYRDRESWVHRRARECCAAHEDRAFGTHIPTAGRTPAAIAEEIVARIADVVESAEGTAGRDES